MVKWRRFSLFCLHNPFILTHQSSSWKNWEKNPLHIALVTVVNIDKFRYWNEKIVRHDIYIKHLWIGDRESSKEINSISLTSVITIGVPVFLYTIIKTKKTFSNCKSRLILINMDYNIGFNVSVMQGLTKFIAEVIGTGFLMFGGCMGCFSWDTQVPNIQCALSFGLTVMIIIQCYGHISGAHLNPAVTVAAVVFRSITIPVRELNFFFYFNYFVLQSVEMTFICFVITIFRLFSIL